MSTYRLPASLTSLYRLCLRVSSASVLHHSVASPNLRRLIRPSFDAAAKVIHQLQKLPQNCTEHAQFKAWLDTWETRMDSTLGLLYASSQSRGLSHRLTRNLTLLLQYEYYRLVKHRPEKRWEPHKAQTPLNTVKEQQKARKQVLISDAWAPLGQVVAMAEGRDGLSLGRVTIPAKTLKRRFK